MKNERHKKTETKLLYETDGMLTEFEATVISSGEDNGQYVILDRTAFFPEGGGQQADTGELVTKDGRSVMITDVQTVDGRVRHYASAHIPEGDVVSGKIDAAQRSARMQNHGAEHLVCGIIHNLFGYDNVGFHMTDKEAVFDVDGPLSLDQIRMVERKANEAVFGNVPITVSFPTEEEAKDADYRSKLDTYEDIRLVTIEGFDVCACCAPHVPSTGMIGMIKITDAMPHRGGMRMTLVAGISAYDDYVMLFDQNAEIVKLLSSKRERTADFVRDMTERSQALKEENTALRKSISKAVTEAVLEKVTTGTVRSGAFEVVFTEGLDMKGLRDLVNECTKISDRTICAFLDNGNGFGYIFAVNVSNAAGAAIKSLADDFNLACGGKGGGSDIMITGTTLATRSEIEAYFAKKA